MPYRGCTCIMVTQWTPPVPARMSHAPSFLAEVRTRHAISPRLATSSFEMAGGCVGSGPLVRLLARCRVKLARSVRRLLLPWSIRAFMVLMGVFQICRRQEGVRSVELRCRRRGGPRGGRVVRRGERCQLASVQNSTSFDQGLSTSWRPARHTTSRFLLGRMVLSSTSAFRRDRRPAG